MNYGRNGNRLERKYSPDQERDEQGRFGGGSVGKFGSSRAADREYHGQLRHVQHSAMATTASGKKVDVVIKQSKLGGKAVMTVTTHSALIDGKFVPGQEIHRTQHESIAAAKAHSKVMVQKL